MPVAHRTSESVASEPGGGAGTQPTDPSIPLRFSFRHDPILRRYRLPSVTTTVTRKKLRKNIPCLQGRPRFLRAVAPRPRRDRKGAPRVDYYSQSLLQIHSKAPQCLCKGLHWGRSLRKNIG